MTFSLVLSEIGPNYETTCDENSVCTSTIYSYQKYYQENNEWVQIDENFGTENCEPGYFYCVDKNLYQFNTEQSLGELEINYGGTILSFFLNSIGGVPPSNSVAEINGNLLIYRDVIPGIDVRYIYLPHKIKEEIIFKNQNAIGNFNNDIDLRFNLISNNPLLFEDDKIQTGDLFVRNLVVYDSEFNQIEIPFSLDSNVLTMTVPIDWLTDDERVYPIYIDPTIETSLAASEDVYVENHLPPPLLASPNNFTRYDQDAFRVGFQKKSIKEYIHRSDIDFDISGINDSAKISDLNLTLIVRVFGDPFNYNISVTHMEGNTSYYVDSQTENKEFWRDMGNGTNYTIVYYSSGTTHYFNLSNATTDFENSLSEDYFNLGFYVVNDNVSHPGTDTETRIYWSSESADSENRPSLVVSYFMQGVNETIGDAAIEQGILNSLPNATIHDEQQVYIRLANGTQQVGRFDKFVMYNNQRWAFNYVTGNEGYVGMGNVSNSFFVLELEDLFADDIVEQVGAFINGSVV